MNNKVFKQFCPVMKGVCLNGFVKGMPESDTGERTTCAFFIQLAGQDPQTGEKFNDPGCSVAFMPIIALEGNQHMRQVIASADKTASAVSKGNESFLAIMHNAVQKRLNGKTGGS